MASKPPEFPKPMWLPDNPQPVYAHRDKDEEKFRSQGYVDRCPHFDYPRVLYREDGHTVTVQNAQEEKAYSDFGRAVILKPAPVEAEATPAVDLAGMQAQLAQQARLIEQLLSEKEVKPKKNKKQDEAEG